MEVIKLHHLINPYSTIAEQARRNNLKGYSLFRVKLNCTVPNCIATEVISTDASIMDVLRAHHSTLICSLPL